MMHHTFKSCQRRRFTLVELLVVLFIASILLLLAGKALQNGNGDLKLRSAVRLLNAQLTRARSLAVQHRKAVEVRFISKEDSDKDFQEGHPYCALFMDQDDNSSTVEEMADSRIYWPGGIERRYLTKDATEVAASWKAEPHNDVTITFNSRGGTDVTQKIRLSQQREGSEDAKYEKFDETRFYQILVNQYTGRTTTTFYEAVKTRNDGTITTEDGDVIEDEE